MDTFFWTLSVAVFIAVTLVVRRVWPMTQGRARKSEDRAATMNRWNMYMVPSLRRHLTEDMLVGLAGTFTSTIDGKEYTSVSWSLHPSIMPDVDYIALAPPQEDGSHEVIGFIRAEELRDKMLGVAQSQEMFGHLTWIYVWPDDADYESIVSACISTAQFLELHGLSQPEQAETV